MAQYGAKLSAVTLDETATPADGKGTGGVGGLVAADPHATAGPLRYTGKAALDHQCVPRAADLPRDIRVAQVACGAWHTVVLLTHF